VLEIILPNEEPELPQPYLFSILMRDHEEGPSSVYDDLDDLTLANYDEEWYPDIDD
jgi:hypothetical protein